MQNVFYPAPVWHEGDNEYVDIRCDLYVDPEVEDGSNDLTIRISYPRDDQGQPVMGALGDQHPYLALCLDHSEVLGEIRIPDARAAAVFDRLQKALALYDKVSKLGAPQDMAAALEAGVARVQDLVDADAKLRALPLDTDPLTRVEALLPYGEAVKTLEDWAVAAADLLPDAPTGAAALDFEAPDLRLERGDVAVTLEWIGEGASGDYDATDSGDEPLMRIGVERRANGEWEAVDDASYCTNISARASQKGMILAMQYVLEQVPAEGSIKRLMERMSWIELTTQDGDSPDFSRVPA